jgi:C4-dicarboxylate transporter DctQ subunit
MGRIIKVLDAVPIILGTVLMIVISGVVFANVIARYVFNYGLVWSDEVARFSLIWITFLGAAVLVRLGQHIKIDILVSYLPRMMQSLCFVLSQLLNCLVAVILVYEGSQQALRQSVQVSPGLEMNMGLIYTIVPFAGLYMLAYGVANLLDYGRTHRFLGGSPAATPEA